MCGRQTQASNRLAEKIFVDGSSASLGPDLCFEQCRQIQRKAASVAALRTAFLLRGDCNLVLHADNKAGHLLHLMPVRM